MMTASLITALTIHGPAPVSWAMRVTMPAVFLLMLSLLLRVKAGLPRLWLQLPFLRRRQHHKLNRGTSHSCESCHQCHLPLVLTQLLDLISRCLLLLFFLLHLMLDLINRCLLLLFFLRHLVLDLINHCLLLLVFLLLLLLILTHWLDQILTVSRRGHPSPLFRHRAWRKPMPPQQSHSWTGRE